MRIVYLNSDSPYIIGQQGETNAVTLRVDVTEWAADYPDGTGVILFTRPNKVVYPLETNKIVLDGKTYLQTIVTTKENKVPGWVVLQAQWYNGDVLVKSMLFSGKVLVSGDGTPVDPTETVPSWVTEWMDTLREAIDGAALLIEAAETMNEDLEASHQAVSDSEAWAKGTRSGEAVEPTDETYHNNSKYYSEQIASTAEDVEAWANGTRHGTDIDEEDPAYHKNGKYYSTQAAASAAAAAASASEAMTDTPEGYANVVASISPTYDGTKTYAVGAYCLNGGKLYRCTTAIDEPEATFNSAHWTQVNVGSEVVDLKSAVNALPYFNEYNSADVSDGYIDAQGNIVTQIPGWYISDYMPVAAGDTVYYSGLTNVGVSPSSAYYDDSKTKKSVFKQATGSNAFVVPDGIYYVRFSIANEDKETFVFNIQKMPSFDDVSVLKNELSAKYNQGVEQIAPRNWFDKANATTTTVSGNTVLVSPFVAVVEGETFYYSYHLSNPSQLTSASFFCVYYYDEKQTQIGTSSNWINSYTVPSGVAYVKFVVAQPTAQYIMVEKGIQTLVWAAYAAPYYIGKTSDEELQYPSKIYGVAGHELNLYYENAIRYGTMDTIAKCDISGLLPNCKRYRDRLIWTPANNGAIKEIISMYKSDTKTVNAWKPVTFVSAPADTGTDTVKVLVIGDSKTQYGQPTGYLQDLFDDDDMTLELLGTRWGNNSTDQDTTNRHEGRGGWGAYTYCNAQSSGGHTNPFYNPNYTNPTYGGHFDFSYYMENQGYSGVDFVFINLGTNDFGGSDYIYWACMMAIITSIQQYATKKSKTVNIVPVLMEGVYADKLEWATRNEAFFGFRQRLLNNAAMTNVYYNPMYLSMDLHNDFPFTEVPLSYADEFVNDGKTRKYCDDGIHQNPAGFYKNAFSMYAIIKCIKAGIA